MNCLACASVGACISSNCGITAICDPIHTFCFCYGNTIPADCQAVLFPLWQLFCGMVITALTRAIINACPTRSNL
jgi:hypothetical protein